MQATSQECAVCEASIVEPWAQAASEGVVCSEVCAVRDVLGFYVGEAQAPARVRTVRDALTITPGPELPVLRVSFTVYGEQADTDATVDGTLLAVAGDPDAVDFERMDGERVRLAWEGVRDVTLADG